MTHEINIYGVFVPDILVWMAVAYLASIPLRQAMGALGVYRLFWHRALVDVSVYVILLGGIVAAIERFQ